MGRVCRHREQSKRKRPPAKHWSADAGKDVQLHCLCHRLLILSHEQLRQARRPARHACDLLLGTWDAKMHFGFISIFKGKAAFLNMSIANKSSILDVSVAGKRVVIRVDFNVPIKDGKVRDA